MEGAGFSGRGPFGAGAVLNSAFELYRREARASWTIVALIAIPAQVLVWIMVRVSLSGHARAANGTIYTGNSAALPTAAIALLGFLSAILTIGALSRLLVEAQTGQATSWQDSLGYASAHLLPLLGLAIVTGIILILGYTFFVLPGIFFTVASCASVPALMYERVGPMAALSRSWELVRGYWWSTFAALLIALVIIFGASFLVDQILGAAASSSSIDVILTLSGISRALGAILTYPFLAAVCVVIYVNLRAQKEGPAVVDAVPPMT